MEAVSHAMKLIVNKNPRAIFNSLNAKLSYLYSVFDGVYKSHDLIASSIQDLYL